MTQLDKFENLVDLFEKSCRSFAHRELFGIKKGGTWNWVTYAEVQGDVVRARGGLAALGVGRGDRVAIISNNCVQWAALAYATYGLGAVFVPMYEAQQVEEWGFIIKDCAAKVLVVANRDIFEKTRHFKTEKTSLHHIVCLEGGESDPVSYAHLLHTGATNSVPSSSPKSHETANLIYTSGTTGHPKGVVLSHGNIASNVSAAHALFPFVGNDRSLSFLPWAHSFGQTGELHCLVSMGASMALNSSREKLIEELSEVKPTILFSVPLIFNRIYNNVNNQMAEKPKIIQTIFADSLAIAARKRDKKHVTLWEEAKYKLATKLIFSKIRQRFGGQLKYVISGGAALAREVAEFIDSLGIMVYEGYGLTETSPVATLNSPGHRKLGSVGRAIPAVRIVIDTQATGESKQGEIVVYGPNVMQGYHNRPDETKAAMTSDGGFRTGDMGYLDEDGYLWITGRIKEQYKLENGKYVAPAPLEEQLKLSSFIAHAMIYGENKPYNVALIVPDREAITKVASSHGLSAEYEQLLKSEPIKKKIHQELEKHSASFRSFEKVRKFALLSEDFSTQNDMLTPSLKLKRRNVLKKWSPLIEQLYPSKA